MKIYEIRWYLQVESRYIRYFVATKEAVEKMYQQISSSLDKGCWISVSEYVADANGIFVEGEVIHHKEI